MLSHDTEQKQCFNLNLQASQLVEPDMAAWQQWIAAALMTGCAPERILSTLVANGISDVVSKRELELAQNHPYIRAGKELNETLKKRDWVLNSLQSLKEMSPYYTHVERRYKLSRSEFFENYYFQSRPVVINGLLDQWPAMTRWTPDYLRSRCGEKIVEIQTDRESDPNYEMDYNKHKKQLKFADYIDLILTTGEMASNNFYMTARNTTSMNSEALSPLWSDVPLSNLSEYLKVDEQRYPGLFWFGPRGTITPLHHDLYNNFMAQIQGRKLVRIFPSTALPKIYNHHFIYSQVDMENIDYERFPDLKNVKSIDIILEPGEVLFLPVGCWHYVKSLETSITIGFTNFLHANEKFSPSYPWPI
jgi:Cupin-like domain